VLVETVLVETVLVAGAMGDALARRTN